MGLESIHLGPISRPPRAKVVALRGHSVASLAHSSVLGKAAAVDSEIHAMFPGISFAGPALTVRARSEDNLVPLVAGGIAQPGDVVVIDAGGRRDFAVWGSGLTATALARGVVGIVIDGSITNLAVLRELSAPVLARGTCASTGPFEGPGEINVPVACGGVVVNPGDVVAADEDGAVVVPAARLDDVIERLEVWEAEIAGRKAMMAEHGGWTLFDVLAAPDPDRARFYR